MMPYMLNRAQVPKSRTGKGPIAAARTRRGMDGAGRHRYARAMLARPSHRYLHLLLAIALLWFAPPARAHDLHRDDRGRLVSFGDRPISVYLHASGGPSDVSLAAQIKAVQGALEAWQGVPGTHVALRYGGVVAEPARFDIDVGFDSDFQAEAGEVLAKTLRSSASDGKLLHAQILLNSRDVQWTGGFLQPGRVVTADLQGVITHQIGHALGLGHSRDRSATMYFYGTKAVLRSLSADDQRGLRVLWPSSPTPTSEGGQCDGCDSDAHCAPGAVCLAWPDGARHCALACQNHDDCPTGHSCGSYKGGQACLPNDEHCKADAARTGLGGNCASDLACGNGFCQPAAPVGFCAGSCQDCGAPAQCVQTNVGPLCLLRGPGLLGDPCWIPSDCKSMLCAPSVGGGGRCTLACTGGCPSGYACSANNTCEKPGGALSLPVGWPCQSGFDCATGLCHATPGARFDSVCSISCKFATDCPLGTGCSMQGEQGWCIPSSQSSGVAGQPCSASGQCSGGLRCDKGYLPELGTCRIPCDPYAAVPSECASGEVCVGSGQGKGVCRPAIGGQKALGQPCSASEPCRDDLICAALGSEPPVCLADCAPTDKATCSSNCAALAGTPDRGVCSTSSAAVAVEVAPLNPPPPNLFARSIALPDVVPAAQWKYAPKPSKDSGGCAVGSSAQTGLLWGLGALLIALRRRRSA